MKKYLVLYKAPTDASRRMSETTPEQQAEGMKAWMEWARKCGSNLVDLGQPLANGVSLTQAGGTPANSQVAGFSILQAANLAEAEQLLQGHPHLAWDAACSIELHETQPIPGM